jgi:hypothetical protein
VASRYQAKPARQTRRRCHTGVVLKLHTPPEPVRPLVREVSRWLGATDFWATRNTLSALGHMLDQILIRAEAKLLRTQSTFPERQQRQQEIGPCDPEKASASRDPEEDGSAL